MTDGCCQGAALITAIRRSKNLAPGYDCNTSNSDPLCVNYVYYIQYIYIYIVELYPFLKFVYLCVYVYMCMYVCLYIYIYYTYIYIYI